MSESAPSSSSSSSSSSVEAVTAALSEAKVSESEPENDRDEELEKSSIHNNDELFEVKVESLTNTIYQSAQQWTDLSLREELLTAVYAMGYKRPSQIQSKAIPVALAKHRPNLIAQAETGSGKTGAYLLSILQQVDETKSDVQALVISPTRELSTQIYQNALLFAKNTKVSISLLVAASEFDASGKSTSKVESAQLIVGTPGSIINAIEKRIIDVSKVLIFVCDEADHMVDDKTGMAQKTTQIKAKLPKSPPLQVLLFSATFRKDVQTFANFVAPKAEKILIKASDLYLKNITHFAFDFTELPPRSPTLFRKKLDILSEILAQCKLGQTMIFVNTRLAAKDITRHLREAGFGVAMIHGADRPPAGGGPRGGGDGELFTQKMRDNVMEDFRTGKVRFLVTTDVLARGIDVTTVTVVINYDVPFNFKLRKADPEMYIHRVGRTGRFGRKGVAVSFFDMESKNNLEFTAKIFNINIQQAKLDQVDVACDLIDKALKA